MLHQSLPAPRQTKPCHVIDELGKRDTDARNTTLSMNMLLIHEKNYRTSSRKREKREKRHDWKDHNVYIVEKNIKALKDAIDLPITPA
jgi:hypothetical protein